MQTGLQCPSLGRWVRGLVLFPLIALTWIAGPLGSVVAQDSPPPILQYFESTYNTLRHRTPDLFMAGYGSVWVPPPFRADLGNFSVGYDVYDRFDLGTPQNRTLYGTEAELRSTLGGLHRANLDVYADVIWNHNGYSGTGDAASRQAFKDAGGYPGFFLEFFGDLDGDFNGAFDYGDIDGRLAGLIDIDHAKNYRAVRSPVPGFNNIAAGATPWSGRLANVATEANRRFYPDRNLQPIMVYDPVTGEQNIAVYPFNLNDPLAGDPVEENATGYLMRNSQWLINDVGFDGFRIDAAKHLNAFAFDFLDRSVYRQSRRTFLNGQQRDVFSFSENFDGNKAYLASFVKKDIDPGNPGRIGGNRDVLDFPLHFALKDNLTGNGFQNNWHNVRYASQDWHDGNMDGSMGVKFVSSHDKDGPYMGNVAHAYVLLTPGNANVYYNAQQHGTIRETFPRNGRGDALGGVYGNSLTDLVEIRNSHGRGAFIERWVDTNEYAFERDRSMLVLLSNRNDGGFDSRTLDIGLPYGTPLIELTGNAKQWNQQVGFNDIPELLTVRNDYFEGPGRVDIRFLRNNNQDLGYLVYGLATPQGTLAIEGKSSTLAGGVVTLLPTSDENGFNRGNADTNAYNNATTRLADIDVVAGNSFAIRLDTAAVNLLGVVRDRPADGDNALFKIDEGMDVGDGVLFTQPGGVVYGFQEFTTSGNVGNAKSPGFFNADGNGHYRQVVDASLLSEGYHYVTVRAFRHRSDGGPAVFTDFKKAVYVDRLRPESGLAAFDPIAGDSANRDLLVKSLDGTADSVHVFLNLAPNLSPEAIRDLADGNNRAGYWDQDTFKYGFFGLTHGNHALTVLTFEATGNWNVQRFAGNFVASPFGAGLGDVDFDQQYEGNDLESIRDLILGAGAAFNPAADFDGDGYIGVTDWGLLGDELTRVFNSGATKPDGFPLVSQGTLDYYHALSSQVPEPASIILLLVAIACVMRCRRSGGS
jgi:hypothetical protein